MGERTDRHRRAFSIGMTPDERAHNALTGAKIGDALAMPVHWYYDRALLERDYGLVTDFTEPKDRHPGSIFWRSEWDAPSPELDILGEGRRYWGIREVHYHRGMHPGENTLTMKLGALVWESLEACGGYDADDYLARYVELMTHPERHGDTYIEECHRGFFTNLGKGRALRECAVEEKHISGLAMLLPVALYYADDPETGTAKALEHLELTHAGKKMRRAAEAVLSLLFPVLGGASLVETIESEQASQRSAFFGFPFGKWLADDDSRVVGRRLSTACYVEDSVPATIYLALKYAARAESGLIANTNLGGDNVHRGAVLGALLGAAGATWPARWSEGLVVPT